MADRRQLNKVSWMRNRLGEFAVFGEVGSGKNSYTATLAYRKSKAGILNAYKKFQRYIGTPIKDVPREKVR